MRALVTGAAGFIGSTLTEALLDSGWTVRGVDSLTSYYDPGVKRANIADALGQGAFEFSDADLRTSDLGPLLEGVDVIFHLAAQPGVRLSWQERFDEYVTTNVLMTHRLLEGLRAQGGRPFVYASSSSVYGEATSYPCGEDQVPAPFSPYGVTKLAGEHLCTAYAQNFGLSTRSLRYFTVYGPRQRPDMAINRLIEAALNGGTFPLFGDGSQVRDFTFVTDVVRATIAAGTADLPPGCVLNVAGGTAATMLEVIDAVADLAGDLRLEQRDAQPGDVRRTGGATVRARSLLEWTPEVGLSEGLAAQVAWHRHRADVVTTASGA